MKKNIHKSNIVPFGLILKTIVIVSVLKHCEERIRVVEETHFYPHQHQVEEVTYIQKVTFSMKS